MGRARAMGSAIPIEQVTVSAYRVPTDVPVESDGSLEWDSTTMVLVEVCAGDVTGIGYTYADAATAVVIRDTLAREVCGMDAMATGKCWAAMVASIRNLGRPGIAAMAISALDVALWDLKAKLLDVALVTLIGPVREEVPVYGSGGFTSYSVSQLQSQLDGWVRDGITRVKMKIGRDAEADVLRIASARQAIGNSAELFVDANGAYPRKLALAQAERFVDSQVSWFEEPVYHLDLEGLRLCRDRAPATMEISVGEYGYDPMDFVHLIEAGAMDVLQADASRCEGITGLMLVDSLCDAHSIPLSTHCAPSLHAHPACAAKRVRHVEYFHDHVRIEKMFFDGVLTPVGGALCPDVSRPGLGLAFKHTDAAPYAL
jgi:L-alanine-DL-glutamate epimerase-like enolase superfamily enzyme